MGQLAPFCTQVCASTCCAALCEPQMWRSGVSVSHDMLQGVVCPLGPQVGLKPKPNALSASAESVRRSWCLGHCSGHLGSSIRRKTCVCSRFHGL